MSDERSNSNKTTEKVKAKGPIIRIRSSSPKIINTNPNDASSNASSNQQQQQQQQQQSASSSDNNSQKDVKSSASGGTTSITITSSSTTSNTAGGNNMNITAPKISIRLPSSSKASLSSSNSNNNNNNNNNSGTNDDLASSQSKPNADASTAAASTAAADRNSSAVKKISISNSNTNANANANNDPNNNAKQSSLTATRQSTRQQQHEQKQQPSQQQQKQQPSSSTSSRKIPHYDKTQPINYKHQLSTVNQIQIHHQSSTLHYCYNPRNGKWYNQGSTTIYLSLDTSSSSSSSSGENDMKQNNDNVNTNTNNQTIQTKEIALHLRRGQSITITNTKAYTPLPTTTTTTTTTNKTVNNTSYKLLPLPRGYVSYFDPLHKIYTKKSNTFSAMEYISDNSHMMKKRSKRYEADGYSAVTGGGCSMMEEMRCCSIASNFGEMRIQVTCPVISSSDSSSSDSSSSSSSSSRNENGDDVVKNIWKDDLINCTSGVMNTTSTGLDSTTSDDINKSKQEKEFHDKSLDDEYLATNGGELELELKRKSVERGTDRRDERINLIASRLAYGDSFSSTMSSSSSSSTTTTTTTTAMEPIDETTTTPKKKSNHRISNSKGRVAAALGIKLVIDFEIDPIEPGSHHYGGIHFHSPPKSQYLNGGGGVITTTNQTPHVYTTSGITGDNFGPRCFIPTVDSSSVKHRFSHDLTVKVTSDKEEGLWAAGCGEHFGVNGAVIHSIPRVPKLKKKSNPTNVLNNDELVVPPNHNVVSLENEELIEKEEKNMKIILGKESIEFIAKSFSSSSTSSINDTVVGSSSADRENAKIHVIPVDENVQATTLNTFQLATSIWTTSIWSPCPVRSIGFAIGPFKVVYDPEYYGTQDDDDDDDDDDVGAGGNVNKNDNMDDDDDDEDYPTISESAIIKGEGIRQLYFASGDERCFIHYNAAIITAEGLCENGIFMNQNATKSSALNRLQKKQFFISIMGATAGVPNRALSLMRDILTLPSYRTMSYTQIWIPNAVDGGSSCGALHSCPEVSCNPFLGGAILDATILPPLGQRLPFHPRGRALQLLQARCAIKGWLRAALPLGGSDEIGHSYINNLFEEFIMNLYERAHGAFGEGGAKQSFFYTKRFAINSGLNSRNMDFLPIHNVEEEDFAFAIGGVVGALPAEDQSSDRLFRNANNGTESHTAALDESLIRQLLSKDALEGLERGDKSIPLPSGGWLGSTYCATFLSSNSSSSSSLGVGSVELTHPTGGMVYRSLKCRSLRRIIQGRIGLSNFIRVIRAAFIAAILQDKGATNVSLPAEEKPPNKRGAQRQRSDSSGAASNTMVDGDKIEDTKPPKPIFILCVDELIKKGGMTHGSLARTIQNISGPIRHPYLVGTIVDVSRDLYETTFLQPEGFPNSFVRGSSGMYLRVGAYVDSGSSGDKQSAQGSNKLQVVVEPVIPNGGIAFGGPVTIRVVENGGQGQCNEYVKSIASDGSRSDWGPIFLHGDPVTSTKQQNAANGLVQSKKSNKKKESSATSLLDSAAIDDTSFTTNELHAGGYQALELVRFTNLSPLLWVRVDPQGCFDARISLFQPDSCLGEQLFHDGDASSQVEALRALAERPLPLQGAAKIKNVYGVPVTELPVRLLADCLRGSVALHADLPHNPAVRAQAALAIAQWQNNKAPNTKDSFEWTGLKLLIQYFTERFRSNGSVTPNKYFKVCLKTGSKPAQSGVAQSDDSGQYQYLDEFDDEAMRERVVENAINVEKEEDEEHRVRAAAITAIACCRAKDGQTPLLVLRMLEDILQSEDDAVVMNQMSLEENRLIERKKVRKTVEEPEISKGEDAIVYTERNLYQEIEDLPYSSASLIGDTLLSVCYVNASPKVIEDPTTGKASQYKGHHPVIPLMQACYRWLQWDMYKEDVWLEAEMNNMTGIGRNSIIASCAITGLCCLALLRQITTDSDADATYNSDKSKKRKKSDQIYKMIDEATSVQYYIDIFDTKPFRADSTRIAAAQSVVSLCCAVDRNDHGGEEATGLLKALNFLLSRILEPTSSPKLRQTLALLMLDACSVGKVFLNQRAATIANYNDMVLGAARFYNGPLGASYGNDIGNTLLMSVTEGSSPTANAVSSGARKGLRLLRTAGKPMNSNKQNQKKPSSEKTIVQVAQFATDLWRTINGEMGGKTNEKDRTSASVTCVIDGVCAYDGYLRCTLLSLWQCIWPNSKSSNGLCPAVQRVQSWKQHSETKRYKDLGADKVMSIEDDEKISAEIGYKANESFRKIIISEIDRQRWRGELAKKKKAASNTSKDPTAASLGLNQPLDIVEKDDAWRLGSWVTSAAHQRRANGADGGSMLSVTKLRLTMKGTD